MNNFISKKIIRRVILAKRRKLSGKYIISLSKIIENKIENLKEFREAKAVLCYMAKGNEVHTEGIINKSIIRGKKVIVPKVDVSRQQLVLKEIKNLKNDLALGFQGIFEPKSHLPAVKNFKEIDFAILPGIAFDRKGGRIGFGKGFFDKLFMKKTIHPTLCGIAFDFQIIDGFPHSSHDISVDIIVSEKRVIRC